MLSVCPLHEKRTVSICLIAAGACTPRKLYSLLVSAYTTRLFAPKKNIHHSATNNTRPPTARTSKYFNFVTFTHHNDLSRCKTNAILMHAGTGHYTPTRTCHNCCNKTNIDLALMCVWGGEQNVLCTTKTIYTPKLLLFLALRRGQNAFMAYLLLLYTGNLQPCMLLGHKQRRKYRNIL